MTWADGRACEAIASSARFFLPPGEMPMWRQCWLCLEAMAWIYDNLATSSGFVPDETRWIPSEGKDLIAFHFEILSVTVLLIRSRLRSKLVLSQVLDRQIVSRFVQIGRAHV